MSGRRRGAGPAKDERHRLLGRIHRRYRTVTELLRIGSIEFPFTRIADPDRVLDEVAAEADRLERVRGTRQTDAQLHLPYWAELWESAGGVGQFLAREAGRFGQEGATISAPLQSLQVLDLGCGMGLSGAIAAALGARVLFADLEPPALLFARLNSLPWANRVRTRRVNWQTDRLVERFDLIVGADILYERAQWPYLVPFWKSHLADRGRILLGEPGRQTGDLFREWIGGQGWMLDEFAEQVATRPKPIRLFILQRTD